MHICCLMPTFARPIHIIENAIACFDHQTHTESTLLILDDEYWLRDATVLGTDRGVALSVMAGGAVPLPQKYNVMVEQMLGTFGSIEAFAVWDDDDLYLPNYLAEVNVALRDAEWCHPLRVWSTYTGVPEIEPARGRFHGSLAVRAQHARWPVSSRGTFDQEMLAKLTSELGRPADSCHGIPSYVFRWNDTNALHCQAYMGGDQDETWQQRYMDAARERRVAKREVRPTELRPRFDHNAIETFKILREKGVLCPEIED